MRRLTRRRRPSAGPLVLAALAGALVGAGIAVLLTPRSGADTRRLLRGRLGRITTGAVELFGDERDIDEAATGHVPVRTVQELGRDPDQVF
jgi:gas vesicle protein